MPEFAPGSVHKATATFFNPKSAGFDFAASLCMGAGWTEMDTASFHLNAGQSKAVEFSVTMPSAEGTYPVYFKVYYGGVLIGTFVATEDVVIAPAVISFTVTLINCPIHHIWGTAPVYFTDGTGTLVPCGSPGSWVVETVPFNFSIAVYADTRGKYGYPDWTYLATYSFSATVENGRDYIYDCATREFGEITEVRRVRAYWKGTGVSLYLWENGLTFNGKRAIDPIWYIYGADLPYALKSTFIIPINARITQIEFKLLGVYGYYVRFDYKWTDQKPGEAEVTIAQGSKSPPYVADPYHAFTHYTIPI